MRLSAIKCFLYAKGIRTASFAASLSAVLLATPIHSEELFSYFSKSDDPPQTSVTISPCTGDERAECALEHSLSCAKTSGGQPQFTMVGSDVGKVASSLIAEAGGHTMARLKLAKGSINLPITSVEAYPNAMDGGWIVTVGVGRADDFFDAFTEKSSEGASLVVAGEHFPLAPRKGDGKKLVAWKYACIALEGQTLAPVPAAKPECEFNSRLYRSPLRKDPDANSYQELQFVTGAAAGAADLTEYRQGKAVWVAHGQFTCSNGASICQVNFPLTLGGPVELPYEMTGDAGSSPETVVIPALRQQVYQTGRNATVQGKAYGGLAVDFLNGFKLRADELTSPYNVYRFADCKR